MAVTEQHPSGGHSTHSEHDPDREPSADWGWHGEFPRAGRIAGWLTALALFAMLIGNHLGRVEDAYLIALGTILVMMLLVSHLRAYKARRRWRD
ncbi:MAG: DUF2631 domain-containing protein [Pseudonocardiaceae bacterium]